MSPGPVDDASEEDPNDVRNDTNTTAPTYAAPNTAHPIVYHAAEPHRTAAMGPYQRSHVVRRSRAIRSPMPITRTSFAAAAVVASVKRWRARRLACAPRSCAARSTAGRHVDVSTVGTANTARSASAGWIDISSAIVTASRSIHPSVVNSDTYM